MPTERDPSLYNDDLAPVPLARRTWGLYNYVSLWVAMSVCIPTYMLASGLIAGGMNWWQAVGTILLGNLIVLVPMLLNAHAGTRYGIPFPVFVRWSPAAGSAFKPGSEVRPSSRCYRSSSPQPKVHRPACGFAFSVSGLLIC